MNLTLLQNSIIKLVFIIVFLELFLNELDPNFKNSTNMWADKKCSVECYLICSVEEKSMIKKGLFQTNFIVDI